MAQDNKCAISSSTFKHIYLLTVIGSYKNGVYGLKRLQKITYISELDAPIKPYTFRRHYYGQYSEELAEINNNLIGLNYVNTNLLQGSQCCVYSLSDGVDISFYKEILSNIDRRIVERIREIIDEFGYLPEDKLLEWCYSQPDFKEKKGGDVVLESEIPDNIEVSGLTAKQCEELELAFSTSFINSMSMIVSGLANTTLDMEKVEKVVYKV